MWLNLQWLNVGELLVFEPDYGTILDSQNKHLSQTSQELLDGFHKVKGTSMFHLSTQTAWGGS